MLVPLEINLFKDNKISYDLIKKFIKYKYNFKNIVYEYIYLKKNNSILLKFIYDNGLTIYIEEDTLEDIKIHIQTFSKKHIFLCYKKCFLLDQLTYLNVEIFEHEYLPEFYFINKNSIVENYIEKIKKLTICKSNFSITQVKYFLDLKTLGLVDEMNYHLYENNLKSLNNVYYICNDYDSENLKRLKNGRMPLFIYHNKFDFLLGLDKMNETYNLPIFDKHYINKLLKGEFIVCPTKKLFLQIVNNIPNTTSFKKKFTNNKDASLFFLNLKELNIKCLKLGNIIYYSNEEEIIFNEDYDYIKHINNLEIQTKSNKNKISRKLYLDYLPEDILGRVVDRSTDIDIDINSINDNYLNPLDKKPLNLDFFNYIEMFNFDLNFDRSDLNIENHIVLNNTILNEYNIMFKNTILYNVILKKNEIKKYNNALEILFNKGYFFNELGLTYYIQTKCILDNTIILPYFIKIFDVNNLIYFVEKNLK